MVIERPQNVCSFVCFNSILLPQDLPNNMIHQVPIKSLPQEWLWCETWCDDASKAKAKTIDLVLPACSRSFFKTSVLSLSGLVCLYHSESIRTAHTEHPDTSTFMLSRIFAYAKIIIWLQRHESTDATGLVGVV